MTKNALFLILLLLMASCSGDKAPEPSKPSEAPAAQGAPELKAAPSEEATAGKADYRVSIKPADPTMASTLTLSTEGFEVYEADILWLVNGEPVSSMYPDKFEPAKSEARKGDEVQARAKIGDVTVGSNIVKIRNSPPELKSVKISPEVFGPGDSVGVEAEASDADGDPVRLEYEWTRNGTPAGRDRQIGAPLQRGDIFTVRVIPTDGQDYGRYVYLERRLDNLPPMFAQDYRFDFNGELYTYQARATDPDGDKVTYSLKSGPQGMTVDPESGLVKWKVPPEQTGTTTFVVAAEDGHGGRAEITLNFKLAEPAKAETEK